MNRVLGFVEFKGQKRPSALGIYDLKQRKELSTFTLELREYSPSHILTLIPEDRRLKRLKRRLELTLGNMNELLGPVESIEKHAGISVLPKPSGPWARFEVRSLLKGSVVDEDFRVSDSGELLIEACRNSPNPFFTFAHLALTKAVANRIQALSDALSLISPDEFWVWRMDKDDMEDRYKITIKHPILVDRFYMINIEEPPGLFAFPVVSTPMCISNASVYDYYKFHYLLRKKICHTFLKKNYPEQAKFSVIERFATRGLRAIFGVLGKLGIFQRSRGYRFFRFPTSLLRALAWYAMLKHPKGTLEDFRKVLRDDFRIAMHPRDIEKIKLLGASKHLSTLVESNYAKFVKRLQYAGIIEVQPDGEAILV